MRQHYKLNHISLLPVLLLSVPHAAEARFAKENEATHIINSHREHTTVRADGATRQHIRREITVLKDSARTEIGTLRIKYNKNTTKFELVRAVVISNGYERPANAGYIEDKAVAGNESGFEDINQVTIAFSDVEIGSRIEYEYILDKKQSVIPGQFSTVVSWGIDAPVTSAELVINSELPLYTDVRDRDDHLRITSQDANKNYELTIRTKFPFFQGIEDEPNSIRMMDEKTTVYVSTTPTYEALGAILSKRYEPILSAELPNTLYRIYEATARTEDLQTRFNQITSRMAERFRYQGDWRPVHGGVIPRPLWALESTRFGDCKDFSAALVAILRKQGLTANVALVHRGEYSEPTLPRVGNGWAFNHAIVHVLDNGRNYWIDPTNRQSFAQGIFEDIDDRDSLILDSKSPRLAHIPALPASEDHSVYRHTVSPSGTNENTVTFDIRMNGRAPVFVIGAGLASISQDQVNTIVSEMFADKADIIHSKIPALPHLNERIVRDLSLKGILRTRQSAMRTPYGWVADISEAFSLAENNLKNRISSYWWGALKTRENITVFDHARPVGAAPRGCHIKSKWFESMRKVSTRGGRISIHDKTRMFTKIISVEDLNSAEFDHAISAYKDCKRKVALIYEWVGK